MTDDIRQRIVEILPRLRRFAFTLTRSMDLADDLVQETCAKALTRQDQWLPGTNLDSWLYRIAQNHWLDQRRASRSRGASVEIDDALELPGTDGRSVTEDKFTLESVGRAMSTLPAEQQVIITCVCIEGLSYRETAETLDIPIGTVMSRLARARRALFEAVEGGFADKEGSEGEKHSVTEHSELDRSRERRNR